MKLPARLGAASASLMMAAATMTLAAPRALARTDIDIVAIVVQPVTTQVNTAMTPAVVVHVEEPDGTLDPDYNGPVTLTYVVNQIGAPEPANNTVTAVGGVAVFPDLTFSAVGFGFELQATVPMATSPPSQPFDIVDQLLQCQHGQACQSETVSSAGTSGQAVASAAPSSDLLAATGGGFPLLSCTSLGGVVTFSVTNRSKVITVVLAKSLVHQAVKMGVKFFTICWGSPVPFTTRDGTTSVFNPVNGEYEGLLPYCGRAGPEPCLAHQSRGHGGVEVSSILAPPGDPHITY
jgi:hypothetical protein